ncbi:MAG TPA: Wzz/FepE/Etk N-terminal domain-containing protein [Chloroflexota bacterium]|jgi:capsular polysaccharide biosynthesis protein|nr:Wzz/FepE/Etk N-terminal domain-containing protein [Chloroflexota bacterium]
MAFREYWQIMWRRRHVIVPLVVITSIASAIFNLMLPPVYTTTTMVQLIPVVPRLPPGTPEYYPSEYWRNVYTEYTSDDLSMIVKSEDFATKVAAQIESRYARPVDAQDIMDAVSKTKREHRTLKITVATGNEGMTRMIAEAIDDVLRTDGWKYFTTDDRQPIQINVLSPPSDPTAPGLLRRLMDVALHSAVALTVGIGLAFLLHYLDDHIRDEAEAARVLGWGVLATIPAERAGEAAPSTITLPVGGLLRGWRKTPTTLVVLLALAAVTAVSAIAAWAAFGARIA